MLVVGWWRVAQAKANQQEAKASQLNLPNECFSLTWFTNKTSLYLSQSLVVQNRTRVDYLPSESMILVCVSRGFEVLKHRRNKHETSFVANIKPDLLES